MEWEDAFPFHAVGTPRQFVLGVWSVTGDKVEAVIFEGDHSTFGIADCGADAACDLKRFVFCKDCRAGVAFFLGVIPVLVVARQIKCDLSFLQLGFLNTEKIGICGMKIVEKSFLYTGAQPVNVP